MAALLLDLSDVDDHHVDSTLEHLCKAHEHEPTADIWEPHSNPLVRKIVELFTARGLERSDLLKAELQAWMSGGRHRPQAAPAARPAPAMVRWSLDELRLVQTYLEALAPASFTLDDWMMVVDYLVQRYLPTSDLRSEADWLASRAAMMGRVQAALGEATAPEADTILTALAMPADMARAAAALTPVQRAVLDFGRARAAEHVVGLADAQRQRMRNLIVDHAEAKFLGDAARADEALQSKLLDAFGTLNRDWRRIAVTEATENANQGFVAAQAPGTKIRRVERYRGACPNCRAINGLVLTVVEPQTANKDGQDEVWVGKTNVGRSASPKKRGDDGLIDRPPEERWWPAAGAMHPHCRGSWERVGAARRDPTFDAWLESLKVRKR